MTAYLAAFCAPLALTGLLSVVPGWPKPYSWQYLGVSLAVAITGGTGPGLVGLVIATVAVLWLQVPTPVHPGVEMFVAINLSLLALLHHTRRSTQEANRRLAEADRRKDDYLSMLSHELRNPLAAIGCAVSVAGRHRAENGELAGALDVAARQVANMARMLDDLLDVARITRGQISLRKERFDLRVVVRNAIDMVGPQIEARHHGLATSLPTEPLLIDGDPVRLTQVVGNLLDNAAKYTSDSGRLSVTVARDGEAAVVRVTDSGRGIPAGLLPRIFDAFERREVAVGSAQGGLGLGLALAKRLVTLHGGHIEAQSRGPGTGSEFVVRLPALRPDEEVTVPRSSVQQAAPAQATPRILIVDDNADSAEMLAMNLQASGYEVRTAYGGEDALNSAPNYRPDVVLLDLGMPVIDGYEVADRLRAMDGLQHTRLIALTGYGDPDNRQRTVANGFSDHLVKPVDLDALRRVLEASPRGLPSPSPPA